MKGLGIDWSVLNGGPTVARGGGFQLAWACTTDTVELSPRSICRRPYPIFLDVEVVLLVVRTKGRGE